MILVAEEGTASTFEALARGDRRTRPCLTRSTLTAAAITSTPPRRAGKSRARPRPRSGGPWRIWGSSTSPPIRRRRADAPSGCSPPCRTGVPKEPRPHRRSSCSPRTARRAPRRRRRLLCPRRRRRPWPPRSRSSGSRSSLGPNRRTDRGRVRAVEGCALAADGERVLAGEVDCVDVSAFGQGQGRAAGRRRDREVRAEPARGLGIEIDLLDVRAELSGAGTPVKLV